MPASHYTDEILDGFSADAQSELKDWPSPIEAAIFYISLNRLAVEQPEAFKARLDWLKQQ